MTVGTQRGDYPRAETNLYFKRTQQMVKSLITVSMQQIDFDLMVMSHWTGKPRVVAEQQTNTCPQVISAQTNVKGNDDREAIITKELMSHLEGLI